MAFSSLCFDKASASSIVTTRARRRGGKVLPGPVLPWQTSATQLSVVKYAQPVTQQRAPATASASKDVEHLANQLLELEAQLQGMFQSGKPMPKAAVVNRLRNDIETVKSQLEALMQPGQARNSTHAAPTRQQSATPQSHESEVVKKAKMYIEGVPQTTGKYGIPDWDVAKRSEYELQLAMLEIENARLREEATVLLERQALLEEVARQAGLLHLLPGR